MTPCPMIEGAQTRPVTEFDLRHMIGARIIGSAHAPGISSMFLLDDGTTIYFMIDADGHLQMETSNEHIH